MNDIGGGFHALGSGLEAAFEGAKTHLDPHQLHLPDVSGVTGAVSGGLTTATTLLAIGVGTYGAYEAYRFMRSF